MNLQEFCDIVTAQQGEGLTEEEWLSALTMDPVDRDNWFVHNFDMTPAQVAIHYDMTAEEIVDIFGLLLDVQGIL